MEVTRLVEPNPIPFLRNLCGASADLFRFRKVDDPHLQDTFRTALTNTPGGSFGIRLGIIRVE